MEILVCPTCAGAGALQGQRCPACRGDGRLAPYRSLVLYWAKPLSTVGIAERRAENVIRRVLLAVLLLIGLAGVAALVLEFVRRPETSPLALEFWRSPSVRILFFYLTLWTDSYLLSRIIRERERLRPVEKKAYGQPEVAAAVSWEEAARVRGRRKIDVSRSFTPEAIRAVETAYQLANRGGLSEVGNVALLAALVGTADAAFLFGRLGISREQVRERLRELLAAPAARREVTVVAEEFWRALLNAYAIAFDTGAFYVRPLELFLAVARAKGPAQDALLDLGADEKKIENVTAWLRVVSEIGERYRRGRAAAARRPRGAMNRAMTAIATPALDSFSDDLTNRAVRGLLPPFVNREKELAALFRILEGGGKSVVLVGEPGTGKQAFLDGLAMRLAAEDVPAPLQDKRLVSLVIPKLIAGATPAEVAERLERIFYEVAVSGNIVLAVPAVEGLVGLSVGGGLDLAEILETNISKLGILAVAATTPTAWRESVERSAIGRNFEKLDFPEVEPDGAIQICEAKVGVVEAHNRVFFTYDAIEKAVTLADRYLHDRFLPEKAIEILREVGSAVRTARGERALVGGEDVAAVVAEKAKVPVTAVSAKESDKLLKLEEEMHRRVIGQDEAVVAVARAIRRARTELVSGRRPIANFLFLGPTGVGKTELAKTVAESYFGQEETMIRLDMSEYQESDSINRLIGAPGGRSGGVLTEAVRERPSALLLLDEIEKAHPDILNVFLQVMDDGRLTDAAGRTADFTNVIIIATSNAGSEFIQDALRQGQSIEAIKEKLVNEQLKGIFRPEFLNRFDGVIVFRPLALVDVEKIARLMLIAVAKQLEARQITLQATEEAVSALAAAGFDPLFGARPLRRVIQERVQDALARMLLEGRVKRRDTVVLQKDGTLEVLSSR